MRSAGGATLQALATGSKENEHKAMLSHVARDNSAPLLGREREQSLLRSLLDDVTIHGQALVLRGEPGVGKSRLLF
jgi:hypothetical protein